MAKDLFDEQFKVTDKNSGEPMAFFKYRIENGQGKVLLRGYTDKDGFATRIHSAKPEDIRILPDED